MNVTRTMTAGAKGTQRYLEEWGHKLVAVRYRKDTRQQRMLTTIEIIVDERPLHDRPVNQQGFLARRNKEVVALQIDFEETELRQKIKQAGAKWSPVGKLWLLPYERVIALAMGDRIVENGIQRCVDVDTSIWFGG